MREAEIATRDEKYTEKKHLTKKGILLGYVITGALLIFTVITKNLLFLFLFVTVFSTIINYQTNLKSLRFNPQPEVFSSLLLAKVIGFHASLLMLLIPTLIVDLYTARLDKDTFLSIISTLAISYIMAEYAIFSFLVMAIILVSIKFIVNLVIGLVLDISPVELLFEHVLGFIANIVMFLAFGNFFMSLFA